ncbi:MAG: PEP-CTERM sorting domain-containing protein [Acidobacteriaceae bacterium]
MIRRLLVLTALLFLTAAFAAADNFTFTYTGNAGDTASGMLTATNNGDGSFQVTSVTNGLYDGLAITGLNNFLGADNLLFVPPNPGYLDFNGLGFDITNGDLVNIYYNNGAYELISQNGAFDTDGTFTLSGGGPPPIPEPSSILLFGTGLLGAAGAIRRKFAR